MKFRDTVVFSASLLGLLVTKRLRQTRVLFLSVSRHYLERVVTKLPS